MGSAIEIPLSVDESISRTGGPHPDYEVTALVLQGGGALGSYQAGIYEGLAQACNRTGLPGSRLARSTRPSLPAIRPSGASSACADSGNSSAGNPGGRLCR